MDANNSYLRKIKKPLIERKRRERMNASLSRLKTLMMDVMKQQGSMPMTKLEKADILEMTVTHLVQLKNQQASVSMGTNIPAAYRAGYQDCCRESVTYLYSTSALGTSNLHHLHNHLQNNQQLTCYQQDRGISHETPVVTNEGHPQQLEGQGYRWDGHMQYNTSVSCDSFRSERQVVWPSGDSEFSACEDVNGNVGCPTGDSVWRPW